MSDTIDRRELFEVLLHELAEARDDERNMLAQYALLVPGILALVSGLAVVFYQTCAIGDKQCDLPLKVHSWIYVFVPILPIALVAYMAFISRAMVLRSYYLRILELRIHEVTRQKEQPSPPIPSWGHLTMEVSVSARAELLSQLNFFLIFGTSALMLFGCVWIAIWRIPYFRLSVFTFALDGALMTVPIAITVSNIRGGAKLWEQALAGLPKRLLRTREGFKEPGLLSPETPDRERSLVSYLILPRNQEELLKALFIPISFFVGWCMVPEIRSRLTQDLIWYSLGFLFVFEFLIYQARYLWNDVLDRQIDCDSKTVKRRFPCSLKKDKSALHAAFMSFIARLMLALLFICCVFPIENLRWVWHLGFVVSVFLMASSYERIRSRCNAAEKKQGASGSLRAWTEALIVFVGFGYGVRAIVGFWLVGVSDIKALVFLFFGASLFGSTFVALTWALESTRAKREEFSTRKAHLVVFHDAVSRRVTKVSSTEKVLAGHQSLSAPWCWPAILATAALTWFSLYLLREQFHLGPISLRVFGSHLSLSPVVLITMAESCIAGVIVIVPVGPAFYLMGLNLLAMGVLLRSFSVPTSQSVIAATLAGLPLVVTCIFRKMCFRDLPGFTDRLIGVILRGWSGLSSWFTKARGHDEALP